jgi:flagellar FliL protein
MTRKLIAALAVGALSGAGACVLALTRADTPAAATPKVPGTVYVLDKPFVVSLVDGRSATLTIGLDVVPDASGSGSEDGVVREVITRDLLEASSNDLRIGRRREALKARLRKDLVARTDLRVAEVLMTDFTVR